MPYIHDKDKTIASNHDGSVIITVTGKGLSASSWDDDEEEYLKVHHSNTGDVLVISKGKDGCAVHNLKP